MKPLKICVILCILVALLIGSSCEFFTDDKDCRDWDPWDIKIHIKYGVKCSDIGPNFDHNILDALDLRFIGTIRNIDCTGYEEDYYDFNSAVFPSFLFPQYHLGGVYYVNVSPDDFPFLVTNYYEYFSASFIMEATFADGLVLESTQVTCITEDAQWLMTDDYKYTFEIHAATVTWTVAGN
jgi:hypothetical protein